MERKVAVVYAVFSVLAFIALTTWFAFSFFQTKANNLIAAANTFVDVKNSVGVAVNTQGNLRTPTVREYIQSLFLQDPAVDLVSISSPQGEVLYIYSRHASYLVPPLVQNNRFIGAIRYSKLTQRLFTAELPPTDVNNPPDKISALFTVLSRNDIYSLARVVLISLIAFVILTGIVILILPLLRRESGSEAPRAATPPKGAAERKEGPHESQSEPKQGEATDSAEPQPAGEKPSPPPVNELPRGTTPIVLPEPPSPTPQEPRGESSHLKGADHFKASAAEIEEVDLSQSPQSPPAPESTTEHDLPEEVQLPALTEVLGEDPELTADVPEISLYSGIDAEEEAGSIENEQSSMAFSTAVLEPDGDLEPVEDEPAPQIGPAKRPVALDTGGLPVEVTEVEEHAVEQRPPEPEAPSYRSSSDELEDIDDFEDLEALDGHVSPEHPEPVIRRRSPPPEPPTAVEPPPQAPIDLGEPEELLEIPDEIELPEEDDTARSSETTPFIDLSPEEQLVLEPPDDADTLNELELYEREHSTLDEAPGEPASEPTGTPDIEELEPAEASSARSSEEVAPPVPPEEEGEVRPVPVDRSRQTERSSRDLFNPKSGLAWSDHLEQRLSFELDRAASFDQDLSLALLSFVSPVNMDSRLSYANDIRAYFPFRDLCFEHDESSFAIVLPNSDIDQAIRTMENFNTRQMEERPNAPQVFIGLSARNGRLLGGERLLAEAETAITKARADGKNAIFALRVDPGKYREYIKSTLK